jgi:hypothetical protein
VTKVAAIVTEVDRSRVQVVVVVVEADQVAAEGVEADLLARAEVVVAAAEEVEEVVEGEVEEEEEVVVVVVVVVVVAGEEAAEGAEVEVVHPQTVTKRKEHILAG